MGKGSIDRFHSSLLFIFLVSVYLLVSSDGNLCTDASQARYDLTQSIVERLDLAIPSGCGIKGSDGRDYSWFGIGQSLLAVPFYIAGRLLGAPDNAVAVMNTVFAAATSIVVFFFALRLGSSSRASLLTAVFYGLGTFAFPFAKHPFDHTTETLFVVLSVYYMYRYLEDGLAGGLLLSSLCLGIAFLTRYTSILVAPWLIIMVVMRYWKKQGPLGSLRTALRDGALFFAAFLPFLILALWYNYYRFGAVLETGYSLFAARTGLDFFSGTSFMDGLQGFLVSPGKGFFYYSPVALLFFFAIGTFAKRHPGPAAAFAGIIASYLLFLSRNIFWHGDWAWGPRYLLVITPFFIVPISVLMDSERLRKSGLLKASVSLIFGASLIIQLAAVSVDFQKYFQNLTQVERVPFIVVGARGIPYVAEPPFETYFDWHRSPILAQFRFISQFAGSMQSYKYEKPPEDAPFSETIKNEPHMNVFDFWWLYKYYMEGSYYGFLAVLGLLLMGTYAGCRLWLSVRNSCM